jgi:hypothetical protein
VLLHLPRCGRLLAIVDEAEARALVEQRIAGMGDDARDPWTPEIKRVDRFERGWIVFYGAVEPDVLLAGNAPYLVDETTGAVHVTGTAYPTRVYVENYLRTGNPHE